MVRILDLEDYALKNHIPIMEHEGIEFLLNYIKQHNIKHILEIGSAIGYSAIRMALLDKDIKIVTIERDVTRYELAINNIKDFALDKQIEIILADALEVDIKDKFDLIFIDAAKSQYIKFFEKYKNNLVDNGTIISDNLNFHGLTHQKEKIESRNLRQLIRKINEYISFLETNLEFKTEFIDIGDGIGISQKI